MPSKGPLRAVALFGLTTTLCASPAAAGNSALAETLFREGKALMQAKDYLRGCPKLEESYRQEPSSGTLLALAYCQEQSGKIASAWGTYNSVVVRARQEGRQDRERAAQQQAALLEPRISRLAVEVTPDVAQLKGLSVLRDGEPLPAAAWGGFVPVDPGEHVIEVTAEGKFPWRQSLNFGDRPEQKTIRVPALAANSAADSPRATRALITELDPTANTLRTTGLIVGGVGIVGLGVGSVFALRAKSKDSESRDEGRCDADGCDSKGLELNQDARQAGNWATGVFIGGGALIAGGITLFLVGGSSAPAESSLSVTPLVSGRSAGIWLQGGF